MKMKKLMMFMLLLGALPLNMVAQDDDMYFVPTKENKAKEAKSYGMPTNTYYSGSSRNVDDYNRQVWSSVTPIDSAGNDIIDFSAVRGVYPDSISKDTAEDYKYTRCMTRFDDYTPSEAYWEGYRDGRWSSPWYYSNWYWWYDYDPWYWVSPWYYGSYYSWYSPWYYGRYGYRVPYWYYGGGRGGRYYASRPIRRTTYESGRSFFGNSRSTNYRPLGNSTRSYGTSRNTGSAWGGSRSSGSFSGSHGGGGFSGGGRSASGGRNFGGRR